MGTHPVYCHYLRRRCCFCGHSPEEVAAESEVGRDHPVLGCDVAVTALDGLAGRVTRLERVVEQIAGAPVPQILESFVDVEQVPQEPNPQVFLQWCTSTIRSVDL